MHSQPRGHSTSVIFQNPHQNPYTTARHLATISKTRNQCQKPETGNTHTDRRLARTQTTHQVSAT